MLHSPRARLSRCNEDFSELCVDNDFLIAPQDMYDAGSATSEYLVLPTDKVRLTIHGCRDAAVQRSRRRANHAECGLQATLANHDGPVCMQVLRASLNLQGPVSLDGMATFVGQTYNDLDANDTQGPYEPIYPNAQVRRLCHNSVTQNSTGHQPQSA